MSKQWAYVNIRCGKCGGLTRSSKAAWAYHRKRRCGHCRSMVEDPGGGRYSQSTEKTVAALNVIDCHRHAPATSRGWPVKDGEVPEKYRG